jgi:L-iditol 2-dehydrogenase
MKMKANVLFGINDLRYVDVAMPEPKDGEVLVRVKASGICGSDVARVFSTGTYSFPTIPGHEFSGEIATDGSGDNYRSGKRVAVFPLIPCHECRNCREGKYELCKSYSYLGSRRDGGFAEYVAVPEWNLATVPDNVSCEEAAMVEPAAVALHGLRMAGIKSGDCVAIIGPGTIAIIMAQLAEILGAGKILLLGRTQAKLDFAVKNMFVERDNVCNTSEIDAKEWMNEHTGMAGSDIVVEGTGSGASLDLALNIARSSGVILSMGNPAGDMNLSKNSYWKLLRRQITIRGTWNSSYGSKQSDWEIIMLLLQERRLNLSSLITHRFPLSDLSKALRLMKDASVYTNKIMINI